MTEIELVWLACNSVALVLIAFFAWVFSPKKDIEGLREALNYERDQRYKAFDHYYQLEARISKLAEALGYELHKPNTEESWAEVKKPTTF